MNKVVFGALLVILLSAGALYYYQNSSISSSSDVIKIGVASLLVGDFAVVGENIVAAAQLAADELNAQGGIDGRRVEIVVENSGCDGREGLDAIQKLVNGDGIRYIIGGMCSNGTVSAAPVANSKKAVILTPVTGGKNVDEAGDYIFRIANADVVAGRDLADAMMRLGYRNVAVIAATTEYTLDIQKSFEARIEEKGGTIVWSEEFQPGTTDYRTTVSKAKAAKPQAMLVLSQLGTDAAYFIKQSREAGFNIPVFTDFTLATNSGVKNILGSLEGIYFADPKYDVNNPRTRAFFEAYEEKYGKPSPIPFHAASTYDGIMLLASAIEAVGDDSEKVQKWLVTNVKNYNGLMGTYSLDSAGNSDLGFTIRVIKNGKPTDI